ncbi:MAG: hypothetical protein A2W91_20260 [Bacteroidetes bacterium GWF2_38_335]|nr:MAG: hypothetical protein A2W91_20260 [Bacteroidetes bacterium GWF2_38_335]OFY79505.1 MAG: hypothetical protein A2281_13825 [Bacteroidetes bacterium RIFOXYA12_FULL_38_20]HBS86556.1 hypothetical protein [Bacteroidales bacterium]
MKKLLTLFLCALLLSGFSQDKELIGLNFNPHVSYYKLGNLKTEKILAFDYGFHYEVDVSEFMYVQLGLTYLDIGQKSTSQLPNNGGLVTTVSTYYHNYYTSIPLNLFIKVKKFWFGVGANANIYLYSKIRDHLGQVATDRNDNNRSVMFGLKIAAGIKEKLTDNVYYHIMAYTQPIYSQMNSINYGVSAGISVNLYGSEE